jgi:hypothetical protein
MAHTKVIARRIRTLIAAVSVALMLGLSACDESDQNDPVNEGAASIDPTPERLDGSSSREFESSDIARAEAASQAVRDYCAGAVSEAQEVGCLSHVDESEIL